MGGKRSKVLIRYAHNVAGDRKKREGERTLASCTMATNGKVVNGASRHHVRPCNATGFCHV